MLNLAPAAALPEDALRAVDVLVVNQTEGTWLAAHLGSGATARELHRRLGGVTVVLTQGEAGSDIASQDAIWHQPAKAIEAIDTTAAGDCFVGVLANGLDRGDSLRASVARATIAAAMCCTRPGSQGSIPTAAETGSFSTF